MKTIAIAIKDLTRSFRSAFAVIFMFGVPLMVTGLFYLMFGNTNNESGFNLPPTSVVIVNLDQGDPQAGELGKRVVETFQSEELSSLMDVTTMTDAAAARASVDARQAGVAVIIPAGFSTSFTDANASTAIDLYQDPTLTLGPSIVQAVLRQVTDQLSGVKITVMMALKQAEAGEIEYAQIEGIVSNYMSASLVNGGVPALVEARSPAAAPKTNLMVTMVGGIMAGMMIFYAFFTATNTASSILREDEEGTLRRLFTTPTSQAEILGGKFISVGLTVGVQVIILIAAARLIFGIEWGEFPAAALSAFAIVCSATAFGIFVSSLMKNTGQGNIVFGGVLTVTGMVGMIDIFTGTPNGGNFGILPLIAPQGWAARSMMLSMNHAPLTQILPYVLVLLALSGVMFTIGVLRFQKRYA